jgi:hypothetical protein
LRAVSCRTTTSPDTSFLITQRQRFGAPGLWGTIRTWYGGWTIRIVSLRWGGQRNVVLSGNDYYYSCSMNPNVKNMLKSSLVCGIPEETARWKTTQKP